MRKSHSAAAAGRTDGRAGGEGMKGRPVKAEKAAIFNYMTKKLACSPVLFSSCLSVWFCLLLCLFRGNSGFSSV